MSITATLSNALSGLTASSRAAEVVSSNVANATTEGYGVRTLLTSARVTGGMGSGVSVDGVRRQSDTVLLNDRRGADASVGREDALRTFLTRLAAQLGEPDDDSSLSGRVARLDAALIEAASRPDQTARLDAAVDAAKRLAGTINGLSKDVQAQRLAADNSIAEQVEQLNRGLAGVADLNSRIRDFTNSGRDPSALMDQRQQLIDGIAAIVPLREVARPYGQVALYTPTGAILVDGTAAEVGFTPVNLITEDMTLASGALSGLTLNGRPVAAGERGGLGGGTLEAAFQVRDALGPEAQTRLDAVARDLVERFQDPSLDGTRAPGASGLFTDGGAAFAPADEPGLAGRLAVNAAVDPVAGGAVWRLRDGLGAGAPGDAGNPSLIQDLRDALTRERVAGSGDFAFSATSAGGLAGALISTVSSRARQAEAETDFASATQATLKQAELAQGVDTDAEMERLLLIEQAYAANARVISAVDTMMQALLRM